jgi:hypothetical protein
MSWGKTWSAAELRRDWIVEDYVRKSGGRRRIVGEYKMEEEQ